MKHIIENIINRCEHTFRNADGDWMECIPSSEYEALIRKIETLLQQGWRCTDPDANQWGRRIYGNTFEFHQTLRFPDGEEFIEEAEINLDDYSDEEIDKFLSSYGWSVSKLESENVDVEVKWLIAECIFEQTV